MHWTDAIANEACPAALIWARRTNSIQEAWNTCNKGDWMLWLLRWNKKRLWKIDINISNQDDAASAAASAASATSAAASAAAYAATYTASADIAYAIRRIQPTAPIIE